MTGTLREYQCKFIMMSPSVLRMKNGSDKSCRESRNTRFMFSNSITKATDTHSEYVILIPFSTAAVVTRTRINITLYVHCLTCLILNMVVLIVTTRLLRVNLQLHGCLIKRCNIHCTDFKNCIIQCKHSASCSCL
jgi:hypothetical protein